MSALGILMWTGIVFAGICVVCFIAELVDPF